MRLSRSPSLRTCSRHRIFSGKSMLLSWLARSRTNAASPQSCKEIARHNSSPLAACLNLWHCLILAARCTYLDARALHPRTSQSRARWSQSTPWIIAFDCAESRMAYKLRSHQQGGNLETISREPRAFVAPEIFARCICVANISSPISAAARRCIWISASSNAIARCASATLPLGLPCTRSKWCRSSK